MGPSTVPATDRSATDRSATDRSATDRSATDRSASPVTWFAVPGNAGTPDDHGGAPPSHQAGEARGAARNGAHDCSSGGPPPPPCSLLGAGAPPQAVWCAGALAAQGSGGGHGDGAGTGGGSGGRGVSASWPPLPERLAAVLERLRAQPVLEHTPVSTRAAAVLVGLFEDERGVVRVLLTQRSARLRSHRGEVCLPGGKRDEGDPDDAATALREAHEELGLDPSRVTVLGRLPPVLSKHHLSVTPVLALLSPDAVPSPNPAEVAAAFTVPLAVFLGQLGDPRVGSSGSGSPAAGDDDSGPGKAPAAAAEAAADADAEAEAGAQLGRRTRRRTVEPEAGAGAGAEAEEGSRQHAEPLVWRVDASGASATGGGGGGSAGGQAGIGADCAYASARHESRDIRWGEHTYRIHHFLYGERCPGSEHYSSFYWDGSAVRVRSQAVGIPGAAAAGADE
ncbi:hypothetical protein GPECTOR_324g38 [Gonium pectorale]|uniref:Nudix hydrolase domain-containing protein n=1 Tax=Gonium pectorale TaxID=33097 RepID=A0A150FVR6_GONPE|nr:hypothetical protein GPECTOR_324g38 [Gonium pectorale]|eukprot:KXZ41677.1 hypothetical protein GPECTOR_324g38 [Gonium pectorale]